MSDFVVLEGGKLIKQVIIKKGSYEHRTGPRLVRIKVRGWLHVALDNLGDAYPDRLFRLQVLPRHALLWSSKSLEKLLRYGLIDRDKKYYSITSAGLRVLKELNAVETIPEPRGNEIFDETEHGGFVNEVNWKYWDRVLRQQMQHGHRGVHMSNNTTAGFRMITTEIPGSVKWEKYFETKTW